MFFLLKKTYTNEEKKNEHDLAEESLYSREIFFRQKKSRKMCG